jgi:hypothetical protein
VGAIPNAFTVTLSSTYVQDVTMSCRTVDGTA